MNGHEKTAQVLMNSLERINQASIDLRKEVCQSCIDGDVANVYKILSEMPKQSRHKIINGFNDNEKSALYL